MEIKIAFTDSASKFILSVFDYRVNEFGLIVDKNGEFVLDMVDKEPVYLHDFAGICKEGIIKGDLFSIMELVKRNKELTTSVQKHN